MSIRFKNNVQVHFDEQKRTVYARKSGEVIEFSLDEPSLMAVFLALASGSCSDVEEIARLCGVNRDMVEEIITQLDDLYLLTSSDPSDPGGRYARNINFFDSCCRLKSSGGTVLQSKLHDAKVALLGLGGLGSYLLFTLAGMGVGAVRSVDFDVVSLSNLNRQILYREQDLGMKKAEIATKRIADFNSSMKFEAFDTLISSVRDVAEVIKGCSLVICVADRPKKDIIRWVNHACVDQGTPLIFGGLDTQVARYGTVLPGFGCTACWKLAADDESEALNSVELRGDHAAFAPLVSMLAGYMSAEATKILTGVVDAVAVSKLIEIDFATMMTTQRDAWEKNPSCPVCAEKHV